VTITSQGIINATVIWATGLLGPTEYVVRKIGWKPNTQVHGSSLAAGTVEYIRPPGIESSSRLQ
jgi:hypothetical protein